MFNLTSKSQNNNSENEIFDSCIDDGFLTKDLLANKLKYSVSYINKLMSQKKIPYLKVGRSVRFRLKDVVAALLKGSAT